MIQAKKNNNKINILAPPKKRDLVKMQSTKADYNDKDLISNGDQSFYKNSMIKPNENKTEFSFDNIGDDNKMYIDNLMDKKKNVRK